MKFAVVCLFAVCAIVYVFARPDGYTNKYDNIDVDQILQNDRLLKRYTDCLLEKNNVRCPPEASELKSEYPLTINNCNKKIQEILNCNEMWFWYSQRKKRTLSFK